jgi:ketosteroid isomerase-like protein
MSQNKQTVQTFMDAFVACDRAAILSCLTDDVEWLIPGAVRVTGKPDFDKQIESGIVTIIKLSRMTEEHNVVVAEGSIRCARKDGSVYDALFCDVFVMQNAKIKSLTAYLMETKDGTPK